jgi:hypothetical protein
MDIPTFYIENPAGLELILASKPKTIVFKLFDNADSTLSLYAFSGKTNHKDFGGGIKLKTDSVPLFHVNKACLIGDLQIGNHGDVKDIDELEKIVKNNIIKKLLMKPIIESFEMPSGYNQSTLTYDFSFLDNDDNLVPNLFISRLKPCPPYNSN